MTIFDKYNAAGLIPFSFNIDVHEQTRTKIFKDIPTFGIYKKFNKKNIDETKNGHGVIMGTKQGDKYIIGLDIDNKPGIYDGLEKWKALLNKHYKLKNENDDILFHFDTPTQKTGTNGYHYLFLVSQEQLKIIGCSITGLYIDDSDDKYKIDIKATNQFLACEPSNYDGKIYKWIKAPHETAIINIPNWIFNIIVKHKEHKPKAQPKEKATPKQQEEQKPLIINKVDNNLYKYLECLDQTRYNNYDNWVNIGRILKNNNIPFEYYLEKSRKAKNFISDDDVLKKWTTFKTQKYSLKSIYWMAKFDNVEQFNKITSLILTMDNINTLFDISKYPQLKINKQYLLNNDNDDNIINKYIDDWQTKDIKTLNIKSKYGSGKTQLLKNILTKYKPKRVLWLTYRQTLTDNIEDEFIKFGFKSYLDHITDADRQILQLESIHKLYLNENDEDDEFNDNDDEKKRIIPKYDLIILDEIESILNHFNSTTFSKKHNSEEAFEDL